MSRTTWSIRKLRELAMQRLGALAAQLKTKDELYDALAEHAPDAVGLVAPVKPGPKVAVKAPPPEAPKPVAVRAKVAKSPPSPAITAPQRLPKKNKPQEREVVRDFFVPPGERALPASFGDDRVMLFPKDPSGVYVSWDSSAAAWGQGGLWLVLRSHDGRVLWSEQIHAAQGARSIGGDFGGASLRAVLERGGAGVGASPAVLMPGTDRAFAERWRVRVEAGDRLPLSPSQVGPEYDVQEAPAGYSEPSKLFKTRAGAPSRLG